MVLSALVSAGLQVLVVSLIPLVVYVITHRRTAGFFKYVGLERPIGRAVGLGVLVGLAGTMVTLGLWRFSGLRELLIHPSSQTGRLRELMEASGVGAMMLVAVVQAMVTTALAEEILFRGFFAKRLIQGLGFHPGNATQAILFGAVHWYLFSVEAVALGLAGWLAVFALPTVLAWLMGWLNERVGNGSIWPSWCTHAVSNLITFLAVPMLW